MNILHNYAFLCCLLYVIDSSNIDFIRQLLLDFLIGARNRKIAKEIYRNKTVKEKVLLHFIRGYLTDFTVAFDVYYTIYIIELFSLIFQSVIVLIGNITLLHICIVIKVALLVHLRLQFNALRKSKYCNGK